MLLYVFWGSLLLGFLVLYLVYYGIFNPIIIHEIEYGPISFFYKEYKGNYRFVGPIFDKIKRSAFRFFKTIQIMGIYYDNPSEVIDTYESRAVLGFFPISDEDNEIKYKFKNHNGIECDYKELPLCEALHVRFPYKSFLSFYVMGYRVYPKMMEYLKRRNQAIVHGIIEEYHFKSGYIDLILPYGINTEAFHLTKIERPKYFSDKKAE